MNQDIFWKKRGGLFINQVLHADWVVKIPTVKNRLSRGGTVGLDIPERYDLKKKKGILYVDQTEKAYVYLSKEILSQYEPSMKDCNGVKKSMTVYPVKQIVKDHNLKIIEIPNEINYIPPHETGIAGEVRRKFGL